MKEPALPGINSRRKRGLLLALCCLTPAAAIYAQPSEPATDPSEPVVKLDDVESVASDDNLVMPTEPTRSVFGLNMSLAETPRSANIVNATLLDNLGIRNTEDLIKATAAQTGEKAEDARRRATAALERAQARLQEAQASATELGDEAIKATEHYVEKNPWQALGIAAGVGLVLGVLLARR